jgi:glycosyltransferase involved in cell wall biosynthesis
MGLPDNDMPIVAVIGCIAPQKGYIELFQALREMPQDFRILLIGDTPGWVTPDPEDVVRKAGWAENTIIRKEFVPEDLMPNLFGAIDIVAVLYREAKGSSGILTLCQQFGIPVLATRYGDIGVKVESQKLGLTADPNKPQEVRHALTQLLKNLKGYENSRATKQTNSGGVSVSNSNFSWADVARAHMQLYAELSTPKVNNTK